MIDNSSLYRYDPDVPLIVPEVNPDAIEGYTRKNIIANPNCSTAQMVVALKPLHDPARIKRVVVATYQSVSGAGKEAMDELWNQTKGIFVPGPGGRAERLPQADRLQRHPAHRHLHGRRLHPRGVEDGGRDQEDPRPAIKVTATCVRVPVFVGHSEAVNVEFEDFLDEDEAREILREAPGVLVVDKREPGGYVTPVECVGEFATFVSRIRKDPTVENGLNAVGGLATTSARARRSTRCRSPSCSGGGC